MGAYTGLKGGRMTALRINANGGRKRGNNTKAAERNRIQLGKWQAGTKRLRPFKGQF